MSFKNKKTLLFLQILPTKTCVCVCVHKKVYSLKAQYNKKFIEVNIPKMKMCFYFSPFLSRLNLKN